MTTSNTKARERKTHAWLAHESSNCQPGRYAATSILLFTSLYLYIYNTQFTALGVGSSKIVAILTLTLAALNPTCLRRLPLLKGEFAATAVLLTAISIAAFTHGTAEAGASYVEQSRVTATWFVECILVPLLFVNIAKRHFLKARFETLFCLVACMAAALSILLFMAPSLNDSAAEFLGDVGDGSDGYRIDDRLIRGFGIASGLRGDFAMTQALAAGTALYLSARHLKWTLAIPILAASAAVNARIALFAIPLALFVPGLPMRFRIGATTVAVLAIPVAALLLVRTAESDGVFAPSASWIVSGGEQVIRAIQGDAPSTTAEELFRESDFLPDSVREWALGTGKPSPPSRAGRVDNGYHYTLWYGGWIVLGAQIAVSLFMFGRMLRRASSPYLPVLFFLLLSAFNVKWSYLCAPNSMTRAIGIFYAATLLFPNRGILPVHRQSIAPQARVADTAVDRLFSAG
jgi:hypothetical protein